jgi:LuxR family maltose regulon positive regulatory protein
MRQMAEDAARAAAGAAPGTAGRCLARLLEGVARHLTGDREAARALLKEGAAARSPAVAAGCHAQLALIAVEQADRDEATIHARAAGEARSEPARTLAVVARAVVAAERGDVSAARRDTGEARRLLAALGDYGPWITAEAHVWLARAALKLSDGPTARMLLARAARAESQVADAPALSRWIHDGWERADALAASATGDGPALTNAELRVLRLLPSHLSLREIGDRLQVSQNTVKTQALAVYRKLDVSSRSGAVARGVTAGLIDQEARRW